MKIKHFCRSEAGTVVLTGATLSAVTREDCHARWHQIKPETLVSLKALPVWYVCSVDVVCVYSSSLNIVPIVATWNIDTCVCISVCCI